MVRSFVVGFALLSLALAPMAQAVEISGDYLESRTCDIYTGPCFANSEVGLTGNLAIMAWSIEKGRHQGVDLAGLKVVLALRASDTLGYGGGLTVHPDPIKSVILVDEKATSQQREALEAFAREKAGKVKGEVTRVATVPIEMQLDHVDMVANLNAGKEVKLATRKLAEGDHCCTNEVVFYPPLAEVQNSEPAYTLDAGFQGRGLGVRWTNPETRSAFLATFAY
jgi:hypothetical protein